MSACTNVVVVGRDSPPSTAATISSKDTRWIQRKQCWRASCGQYLPPCWLTKGLHETANAMLFLVKRGTRENVELCTTLGRETEETHGRRGEIIETKQGDPGHHIVHVNLKNAQGSYHWINRTTFLPASALSETKL